MRPLGRLLHRHRALRWLAPVGVLGAVAVAAGGMITAKASPDPLPPTTPVDLVAGMQNPPADGFSGTIVAQMSLGLPALPGLTSGASEASLTSLLAGSHTLRLWYGGPDKQRVALLGTTDETDVFHSGRDIWQWDSSTHTATHFTLPSDQTPHVFSTPSTPDTMTPQQLASRALALLDKSTSVTLGGTRVVADRSTYVLVLTPRDPKTRIGSVHIAVDGHNKLPLAVQVFARGSKTPALDVAFSDVSFHVPSAGYFRFTPPPGVTVHDNTGSHTGSEPRTGPAAKSDSAASNEPSVIGKGWSAVVEYDTTAAQVQKLTKGMLRALPRVSGTWGTGRLFESALMSALVTDTGHVFVGSVDPSVLYAAASAHR